jgi:leader peptidase (prepilin peptidase)/N-methyltransferase
MDLATAHVLEGLGPLWLAAAGATGLAVGSFLNVCIHRLPEPGQSVWRPPRSYCPSCQRTLTWSENIPLLSFLAQRGRCRGCRAPIAWRYPLVELAAALAWAWIAWRVPPGEWPLALAQMLAVAALIVATGVDCARFEIPDEISIGGMIVAPFAALLVPALHRDTWIARELTAGWVPGGDVGRFAALVAALAGVAAGGAVLLAVRWGGRRAFGREAMGLGDVKLLAAGGGFVGPGGALAALVLASLVGSLAGVGNIARFAAISFARGRRRGRAGGARRALRTGRAVGRYLPFGPYLALGIGIVLVDWNDVRAWIESLRGFA